MLLLLIMIIENMQIKVYTTQIFRNEQAESIPAPPASPHS